MADIQKNIKCLVEECKYNQQKYCNANSIEVVSSSHPVNCADHTACGTFESTK